MQKIIAVCCGCFLYGCCFSQSQARQDSSKLNPAPVSKAKELVKTGLQPDLTIYPNPAKNKITIQVKNFTPGMAAVKVLDIKGKLMKEESRLITNGTEDIIMFLMLKAGIYFIIVSEPGKEARRKLVVL